MHIISDGLLLSWQLLVELGIIVLSVMVIFVIVRKISRLQIKSPSFIRAKKLKNKEYFVVYKDQIQDFKAKLESGVSIDRILLDLNVANRTKSNISLPSDKRTCKIFDDSTFEVHQINHNEFVVHIKPLQISLSFDIAKRNEGIMTEDGFIEDDVEDIIITINGIEKMEFDGRYL